MRKKQLNVFLTTILMVASMSVYAQEGVGYVPLTALDGMLSYGQYDQSHQEAYDKLVDANEQTRWGGWFNPALSDENSWPQNSEESANKMYIIVKTKDGEAVVPTSYFLVTGYDTGSYPGRNWASWKIYGGNFDSDEFAVREGEGWTLIDEREDEPLPAENYGTKDLNFNRADGTTAYKYYWIEIAKTVANSDIYIQMSEWGLGSYETFEQYLDRPTSVDEPVNYKFLSGSSGYAGEGAENLLDGNTATKWMYQFTNREKGQTSNGAYIVFRASRAMTPSYYTLSTANDTESHPGRCWKQWQIYGMNADNDESVTRDSEGWVLLDDKANVPTGNGINELPAANYASSFFTLSETNTEEYRYFKIEVDKIVSGGDMQMSEFALGDEYTCAFENIIFADANVKSICVNNWDTNGDGELSYGEAATVTSIGEVFRNNTSIVSFNELQYFSGLTLLDFYAFEGCSGLASIIIPNSVTNIGFDAFTGTAWYDNQPDGLVYAGKVAYKYKGTMPENTTIVIEEGTLGIAYNSFNNCHGLTSITIPNSVVSIGACAFLGCKNLESITIPNSVVCIDFDAFYACGGLESIVVEDGNSVYDSRNNCNALIETATNTLLKGCNNTIIPKGITSIFESAFTICGGLKNIVIPESVTSIGNNAFWGCGGLESIVVEEGNAVYDSRNNCNALIETASNTLIKGCNNTIIPEDVAIIDNFAFLNCGGLTSIKIPESITEIGHDTFFNCDGLTSIVIPNSVTTIGDSTFGGCSGLSSVTIGNNVVSIGDHVFFGCVSLSVIKVGTVTPPVVSFGTFEGSNYKNATLYVPVGSKAAYEAADYWKDFKEIIDMGQSIAFEDANVKAICVANWDTNNDGELSYAEAAAVTDLGELFKSNQTITTFDELQYFTALEEINAGAFYDCKSLKSIIIPNNVTYIGYDAFIGTAWYDIQPDGLVYVGKIAYKYKGTMPENTTIEIDEGTLGIACDAFSHCYGLISVTFPNSITTIGNDAFSGCRGLTSITIPSSVTTIGYPAFRDCSGLISINVLPGNTKYDSRDNCNAIIATKSNQLITGCKNTIIPNSVKLIENYAFSSRSGLTSITIPNSVTAIGKVAFSGCDDLTTIIVEEGNTVFDSRDNCNAIIETSTNTLIIGCQNTIIPNSVTTIGDRAFAECSKLATITIPESVNTISEYAFEYCNDLTSVIAGMLTPINLSSNSFSSETYETATLYVPKGGKAAYRAADVWKDFKEIMEYNYVDGSQDPPVSEFNAALAAITDGSYYLTTDVNGTKYYVTQNGHLTNDEESAYVFAISKVNASGAVSPLFDVAFLIDPGNGVHFSNPTPLLDGKAYLHLGFFYQDDHNNRNDWDRQVLFLNETGKFAIRSSNTPYDENSWLDAGRTFWTWEENGSIIPCYSYKPAYIWTLEEPVGKVKLYLILDDLYTLYENQLYDDVDNPDYVNMGSGYGQYADWVTWRKFKSELDKLDALIQKFLDEDYNPELDSDCPDLDGVNAWKTEIAALWQKILDSKVTDISELDNAIYIEPFTARVGDKMQMQICLKNADAATAYVFDLVLPEGITVAKNDKGKYIDELSDRHDDHTRTFNYKGNNTYSLSTLSGNSEQLTGNDGPIRLVTIEASDNMVEGNYAIEIKNASYSKPDGTLVSLPDTRAVVTVEDYVLGDVNGNGGVDIGDAVSIVNYLVGKDSSIFVAKAADTNKNGQIDIGDAVTIVNLLVGKITNFTREFNIIWDEKEPE